MPDSFQHSRYLTEGLIVDGNYHASVVCGDGKVYSTPTDGTTTVVRASREYEMPAQNCLDERVQASPAIYGGRLLIRGEHHLYRIAEAAEVSDQTSVVSDQ